MSIIVFDMEWNMGYPREGEPHFDEIIEIGAARIENGEITGTFKDYVRPTFHRVIHHHVRKMLPFTKKDLKDAADFPTVIRQFREFCGPKPQLVSWGNSDISVLQSNLERYRLPEDWIGSVYDLQAGYAYLLQEYTRQYSLKDAVEQFAIEISDEFHDAANDAYYTALIAVAIQAKYGPLPEAEVVAAKREELRRIHAEEVQAKSLVMETAALEEAIPLALEETAIPPAPTVEELLKSNACSKWSCPQCGAVLTATGWSQYAAQGQLTRGHCEEHGWYYAYILPEESEAGWGGVRRILPPTQYLKSTWFRFGHNHGHGSKRKKH